MRIISNHSCGLLKTNQLRTLVSLHHSFIYIYIYIYIYMEAIMTRKANIWSVSLFNIFIHYKFLGMMIEEKLNCLRGCHSNVIWIADLLIVVRKRDCIEKWIFFSFALNLIRSFDFLWIYLFDDVFLCLCIYSSLPLSPFLSFFHSFFLSKG